MEELETFRVEFLLARENHTWETEIYDLPIELDGDDDFTLENWWHANEKLKSENLDVVICKVYCINP